MIWKYWEQGKLRKVIPTDSLRHRVTDDRMPGLEPSFIWEIWGLKLFNFRFPTEVSMLDPKKVNLEVAKMKDYFLTKCQFTSAGSKYFYKVFHIFCLYNHHCLFSVYHLWSSQFCKCVGTNHIPGHFLSRSLYQIWYLEKCILKVSSNSVF